MGPTEAEVNTAAAFVISPKMARAVADTWRSRILMELTVRPLSPSQFVEAVGGELTEISRLFRQLADWGYIEVVETLTGGRRRGAIEHVYRRIQRALFDTSVWEQLPRSYRDECSGSTLESYIARVSEAIAAGTFDDELDRHLSWDVVNLDRVAWVELGERLDRFLFSVPDLAVESFRRMTKSGEDPIPTTIGLASFRSPDTVLPPPPASKDDRSSEPSAGPFVISASMAKALANKWRSLILMELRVRPMSRTQFVKQVGGGRRQIGRYFSQLEEWGFIEAYEVRRGGRRRGGEEKFYRLKQRAHFDTSTWERLPRFLRDECSSSFLHSYFARIDEAIKAGTFDAEVDRHLSWDAAALDRTAWSAATATADEILAWLPQLQIEAAERLAATGEQPIPTTVGLSVFRSPKASQIPSERSHT